MSVHLRGGCTDHHGLGFFSGQVGGAEEGQRAVVSQGFITPEPQVETSALCRGRNQP